MAVRLFGVNATLGLIRPTSVVRDVFLLKALLSETLMVLTWNTPCDRCVITRADNVFVDDFEVSGGSGSVRSTRGELVPLFMIPLSMEELCGWSFGSFCPAGKIGPGVSLHNPVKGVLTTGGSLGEKQRHVTHFLGIELNVNVVLCIPWKDTFKVTDGFKCYVYLYIYICMCVVVCLTSGGTTSTHADEGFHRYSRRRYHVGH